MEVKEYYTLKEIILGLVGEYEIHQQKLQELKKLCEMDEKKVLDFQFRVYQPERKSPILLCDYESKQNQLQKLASDFSKKRGYHIYGRNIAQLVTNDNGYYFLGGTKKYPIHVKTDSEIEENFYQQVNDILNSDFSNNMRSKYIEKNTSNMDAALTINTEEVELYIKNRSNNLPSSLVYYNAFSQNLVFETYEEKLTNQYIYDVLNASFPTSELNPYHIEKIDASETAKKPVKLRYNDPDSVFKMDISEEENQVVLYKKKKIIKK